MCKYLEGEISDFVDEGSGVSLGKNRLCVCQTMVFRALMRRIRGASSRVPEDLSEVAWLKDRMSDLSPIEVPVLTFACKDAGRLGAMLGEMGGRCDERVTMVYAVPVGEGAGSVDAGAGGGSVDAGAGGGSVAAAAGAAGDGACLSQDVEQFVPCVAGKMVRTSTDAFGDCGSVFRVSKKGKFTVGLDTDVLSNFDLHLPLVRVHEQGLFHDLLGKLCKKYEVPGDSLEVCGVMKVACRNLCGRKDRDPCTNTRRGRAVHESWIHMAFEGRKACKLRRELEGLVEMFGVVQRPHSAGTKYPLAEYWIHTEVGHGVELELEEDGGSAAAGPVSMEE